MNPLLELAELRAVHAHTLDMLAEVSAYMARLPHVPMTRAMCDRIEAHLADPNHSLLNERARLEGTRRLHVARVTPASEVLLTVDIDGAVLRFGTGVAKTPAAEAECMRKIFRAMRERHALELRPGAQPDSLLER